MNETIGASEVVDVCVIGAGQSGLAVGYHLQRRYRSSDAPSFVILDDRQAPGGSWADGWDSLHLFSPASYSSLPGWPMPPWTGEGNPNATHVVRYLTDYERRYDLPVRRPVQVAAVTASVDPADARLVVRSDATTWTARVVVNSTGTWRQPFWPRIAGMEQFTGRQLHTVDYRNSSAFADQRVLVVGGGNSAAQIAADLLPVAADVAWVAVRAPRMLPDDVDGRVLFETATRAVQDRAAGRPNRGVAGLGDIVAVPSVRHARDHLGLKARPMFERLTATGALWPDGHEEQFDAVIWCTGFRPALRHLRPLQLPRADGHPSTVAAGQEASPVTASLDPRVMFVGYGDWCGPASATLIGVNRPARDAVSVIMSYLGESSA